MNAIADSADTFTIRHADTESQVRECYPLMRQLRPALADEADFVSRWKRQAKQGYRLLVCRQDGHPVALAGYREVENLIHDRHLYVDDLVTDDSCRGSGHGSTLIAYLREAAMAQGCANLVLDSGMSNAQAHRFYYREGLLARALHFTLPVA